MSEKVRKLKEDASRLIAKGKLAEAADTYDKIVKADNKDLTARQKYAELLARLGKRAESVREYQSVAGSYAADGLLLKAIAVCKIILSIDPAHSETQHILADLSTKRRGESSAVEMPKSMSAALTPSGKRSANEIRGAPSSQVRPKQDIKGDPRRPATSPGAQPPRPAAQAPPSGAAAQPPRPTTQAPPQQAARPQPPAQPPPAPADDDLSIDVSFDSSEGAPVIDEGLLAAIATHMPVDVSSPPVLLGRSVSQEGEPVADVSARIENPTDLASVLAQASFPSADVLNAALGDAFAEAPAASPSGTGGGAARPTLEIVEELPSDLSDELLELQREGALASASLPQDEVITDDDGGEILDLEPTRVDVDKVPPIPLFSDLPKQAFISLTERMELRIASAGDVLMAEGERGASMFIIIQGKVSVSRKTGDDDVVLAELTDGTFFGEMALLSDAPRTATITCVDDTMLFEISRELLNEITQQHPSVGDVMKRFHKNRLLTNLLKTSPIFQPFNTKDKKDLIEKFKSRSVNEGTYLITRERPGEGLYVLLSGRCEVLDTNGEGKQIFLAELKEGDVFGEMSMLWHKQTCASVKALTPCVVLRLPRENFNEVIMTHPQILETLTALSEARQRQNQDLKAPPTVDFIV